MSLAALDLDHFKHVNDRYGHAVGDHVLRRLAEQLGRTFRNEDVLARWGGEEFIVGMYGMSRDHCVQRVNALLEAFRAVTFTAGDGEKFSVTLSAGVAQYPDDGADTFGLYQAADEALYVAKTSGRDQVRATGGAPYSS